MTLVSVFFKYLQPNSLPNLFLRTRLYKAAASLTLKSSSGSAMFLEEARVASGLFMPNKSDNEADRPADSILHTCLTASHDIFSPPAVTPFLDRASWLSSPIEQTSVLLSQSKRASVSLPYSFFENKSPGKGTASPLNPPLPCKLVAIN